MSSIKIKCNDCNGEYLDTDKAKKRHLKSKRHIQSTKTVEEKTKESKAPPLRGCEAAEQDKDEVDYILIADAKRAMDRLGFDPTRSDECPLCNKINTWDENRLLIEVINNKLDQVLALNLVGRLKDIEERIKLAK
jgi:hypothetical protein